MSIRDRLRQQQPGFHSTDFPSEWGRYSSPTPQSARAVSIQLISPASGDNRFPREGGAYGYVSIQLISPASGDGFRVNG